MRELTVTTPDMGQIRAALKRKTLHAAVWEITPELAKFLIEKGGKINAGNRDLKQSEIKLLAKDMAGGAWLLTGDSVKLGSNGTLLDGQHRLFACARSNVSFTSLVLSGVDPAFYTTMDTGKGKSAADIFKKADVKYHAVVASAMQHLRRWMSSAPISDRSTDKPHTLLTMYREQWPNLHEFAGHTDVLKIRKNLKHPHSTLTALYAMFSSIDEAKARSFFTEWAATDPRPEGTRSPVSTLQRSLFDRNANLVAIGGRMDDRDRVLMAVRAWRAHAFGERMTAETIKNFSARAGTEWPGIAPAETETEDAA